MNMKWAAFAIGLLFGFGLLVSGMANPAKVQNFLDLFGTWDASLAFVMGGAVCVTLAAFALSRRRSKPICAEQWFTPEKTAVDGRLLLGSALFGIGWGLVGICPGPALVLLGLGLPEILWFGAAFAAGLMAFQYWDKH